jgi:hypothetical protein
MGRPREEPERSYEADSGCSIQLSHNVSRWHVVSTPDELFRGTLPTVTPDGEPATVIVTRQGHGSEGRVWITFSGAWVTTAVMTDREAERFEQLVGEARRTRGAPPRGEA